MQIKNGKVFFKDGSFNDVNIDIENGKISSVGDFAPADDAIDAQGLYVVPGYVDIHIHGADGSDFCDGYKENIATISKYLGQQGVTTFVAATMSFDEGTLTQVAHAAKEFAAEDNCEGAALRGINMEGPFFSKAKKGAQSDKYIIDPDYDFYRRVNDESGNMIKLVDVAPELNGAMDFIDKVSKECRVSIAHTEADYDTAVEAFHHGVTHITHLFNAMPPFTHRAPGVVGAASDYAEHVELICDGIHIHPAVVRTVFKLFGDDKVCLISDSMRACGLHDGEYSLGGQKVFVTAGKATLENGTIAGSATCLAECVRRAVKFGVPMASALKAATINPAQAARIDDVCGSIEEGKAADILIMGEDLVPKMIIRGGKIIYGA